MRSLVVPPAVDDSLARLGARAVRVGTLIRRDLGRAVAPIARRAFDVVFAGAALAAASPVIAGACVAIKLGSKGPALLRQTRVGQGGRPFVCFKLRTMYADAEARRAALESANEQAGGVTFKIRRDPRITPIGRVLRKLSIDELPQLWNVMNGTMSVFGPRPPLPSEVEKYDAVARRRLEIKPGLTSPWQVSGRADLPFERQVALDVAFIDTATLRDELAVLARTLPAVLTGRGAY